MGQSILTLVGRATGTGWVRVKLDHDYADAPPRENPVTLLVTETAGALSASPPPSCFDRALRELGRHARARADHP